MLKSPFEPCIPTKAATVPDRPEWIHEIKHDGYRPIVHRDGERVRLWTRNGHDWSDRFPLISEALRNRFEFRPRWRGGPIRRRRPLRFQRPAQPEARSRGRVLRLRREHLPRRPVPALDQSEEPAASGVQPGCRINLADGNEPPLFGIDSTAALPSGATTGHPGLKRTPTFPPEAAGVPLAADNETPGTLTGRKSPTKLLLKGDHPSTQPLTSPSEFVLRRTAEAIAAASRNGWRRRVCSASPGAALALRWTVPPKAGAPPSTAIDDRFVLFGPYQRV
jgi:hypothetical protein